MAETTDSNILAILSATLVKIAKLDDYDFIQNAYKGTGGFKDGTYLTPHPRETLVKYERRKDLAYFLNYVQPVIDSHVNPIFKKPAVRTWGAKTQKGKRAKKTNTPYFDAFIGDVDRNGTPLERFMKRAAKMAKLNEVAFIVMDNFAEQPQSQADALKGRIFPYLYLIHPRDITEYATDASGRLTQISYRTATQYGSTKKSVTWTWTSEKWKKQDGEASTEGDNKLQQIPVIPLFAGEWEAGNMKPTPSFYSIARTNLAIFNICSWLSEMQQNQGFAVLTYPIGEGQEAKEVAEIIVGTESVLGYDGSLGQAPAFIAPPGETATMLQNQIDRLIKEIYRMAVLSHVTGVEQKTSGVAKQWDYESTNMVLSDFAQNCEQAEKMIAALFEKFTNEANDFECAYSRDFGIDDIAGMLDELQKAKDLAVGGKFDMQVHKRAADLLFGDIPDDEYDAMMSDIEARSEIEPTEPTNPLAKKDKTDDEKDNPDDEEETDDDPGKDNLQ